MSVIGTPVYPPSRLHPSSSSLIGNARSSLPLEKAGGVKLTLLI